MTSNREFPLDTITRPSPLLTEALREDSNREMDWLWWARQVIDSGEKAYCLKRALHINPNSRPARDALRRITEPQRGQRVASRKSWLRRVVAHFLTV